MNYLRRASWRNEPILGGRLFPIARRPGLRVDRIDGAIGEANHDHDQAQAATIGEVLVEQFMALLNVTQGDLAQAIGVPRKHVNELCDNRCAITVDTALMLARVFSNSADFWLNVQRRPDLWQALHSPKRRQRIERGRALRSAAA